MRFFLSVFLLLFFSASAFAQSTMEYATLTSGITAAAKAAEKDKNSQDKRKETVPEATIEEGANSAAMATGEIIKKLNEKSLYGLSSRLIPDGDVTGLQNTSALAVQESPEVKRTEPERAAVLSEKTEEKTTAGGPEKEISPEAVSIENGSQVKVTLKGGHAVTGKLVENRDDRIQVETSGVPLTYFKEEIEKTESL